MPVGGGLCHAMWKQEKTTTLAPHETRVVEVFGLEALDGTMTSRGILGCLKK
jgi:hypothetical protein